MKLFLILFTVFFYSQHCLADYRLLESSVSLLNVSSGTPFYSPSSLSISTKDGSLLYGYSIYCSTDESNAARATNESSSTIISQPGKYTLNSIFTSEATGTTSIQGIDFLGVLSASSQNRETHIWYCFPVTSSGSAFDSHLMVTGIKLTMDIATIPTPNMEIAVSSLPLGRCSPGNTVSGAIPVVLGYTGHIGETGSASLSWSLTSSSTNPDNSVPVISVNNVTTSPVSVPILIPPQQQTQYFDVDYKCNTPGEFSWQLTITYSVK